MSALNTTTTQIRQLGEQQKTGALLIAVGGKTACLNFANGAVSYIFFKGHKDREAVSALAVELNSAAAANALQIRFVSSVPAESSANPVPAATVISWLSDNEAPDLSAAAPARQDPSRNGNKGMLLTDGNKVKLETLAVEMFGPMGLVACNSAFASTVSLREAIDAIARDLSDPKMEQAFIERVRRLF